MPTYTNLISENFNFIDSASPSNAYYTWNGTGFNETTFLPSQALIDPDGNLYYYDQNYQKFYPIETYQPVLYTFNIIENDTQRFSDGYSWVYSPVSSASPIISNLQTTASSTSVPSTAILPDVIESSQTIFPNTIYVLSNGNNYISQNLGTVFGNATFVNNYIPSLNVSLVKIYVQNYISASSSFANNTQAIPSTLGSTITNAISAYSLTSTASAVQTIAYATVDPTLNASITDILQNWAEGVGVILALVDAFNFQQGQTQQGKRAVQSVIDFKTKLMRQAFSPVNNIRKTEYKFEQQIEKSTYNALASAFPSLVTFKNAIDGGWTNLLYRYAALLPPSMAKSLGSNGVQTFLNKSLTQILGNLLDLPKLANPLDKILSDVNILQAKGTSYFNQLVAPGFSSYNQYSSYINQVAGLLNNTKKQIQKLSNTGNSIGAITNTGAISQFLNSNGAGAITSFTQSQLNKLNTLQTNAVNNPTVILTFLNSEGTVVTSETATTITQGSSSIILSESNNLIVEGLFVSGTGIPNGATVSSVSNVNLNISGLATSTFPISRTVDTTDPATNPNGDVQNVFPDGTFPTGTDNTIVVPDFTVSTDPAEAQLQNQSAIQQAQVNATTAIENATTNDAGINYALNFPPMTPRKVSITTGNPTDYPPNPTIPYVPDNTA